MSGGADVCTATTHKVIHIIGLAACITVGEGIVCDEVNFMLVDKVNVQNPWCIFHDLVHPPKASQQYSYTASLAEAHEVGK